MYMCNKVINRATSVKYLGVIIDENLKWSEHIKSVSNKIIKYSGIFYKIRQKIPHNILRSLYFATVNPHVLLGVEVHANTHKTYLNDLIILNNKLLRNCTKQGHESKCVEFVHRLQSSAY